MEITANSQEGSARLAVLNGLGLQRDATAMGGLARSLEPNSEPPEPNFDGRVDVM
jgi:hypothetical protein